MTIQRTSTGTGRRAFTLIELLTVIAIIGILAAILIPTVSQVREAAKRIHCGTHARQIAIGILTYETENHVLPGPTPRLIQSPLAAPFRQGENLPVHMRPQANVDMGILLEDYVGKYHDGDVGPYFCRSNEEGTQGDPRSPVYILMRNIGTDPPSFFGDRSFSDGRRIPKSLDQIVAARPAPNLGSDATELSQIWLIADIDDKIWTNHAGASAITFGPVHSGGRNMVFFDGHLEYVTPSAGGTWPYPRNSGQPESGIQ